MIQVVGAAEPLRVIRDRYRLDAPIGEGGMATVWRAWDLTLQRAIAVKLLFPTESHTEEALVDRFLREARIAASVQHRNVIHIVDFGTTTEGQPFMVMELLEGETLAARLRRQKPLPVSEVVQIGHLTLRGLAAVHAAGIVHRDLKPENVYLKDEGGVLYPKILDFGISRSIDPALRGDGTQLTREGVIVGTPEYMSPEQARGVKQLSYRTDLYSMGVMLYEALTGQLPYTSENVGDLIVKIVTGCAPPVHELAPHVPRVISEIVAQAMARLPSDRFADATEMQDALLAASMTHAAGAVPMASNLPPETAPKLGVPGLLGMFPQLPAHPLPRTQAVQRLVSAPSPANDVASRPFATTTVPPDESLPPSSLVTEPGYRFAEGAARHVALENTGDDMLEAAPTSLPASAATSDYAYAEVPDASTHGAPNAPATSALPEPHANVSHRAAPSMRTNPGGHGAPSSEPAANVPVSAAPSLNDMPESPARQSFSLPPWAASTPWQRSLRTAVVGGPVLMGVAIVALSFGQGAPAGSAGRRARQPSANAAAVAPADQASLPATSVQLTLTGVPPEARVTLDGKPAGSVMTLGRGDGAHSVSVEAPGKLTWHTSYAAERDQTLDVTLLDAPETRGNGKATAVNGSSKSVPAKAPRGATRRARNKHASDAAKTRPGQGALRVPDF